ncbi:thiamine phosphate synthase [Candidatus Micrarchaeota archaeon]|nr:thiamine phosphate synthase [Candidatus Micrarchaeota archaeon]
MQQIKGLYVITDRALTGGKDVEAAEQSLKAGCKIIQYREKERPYGEMKEKALKIKELCRPHDALFFVNDHVKLAVETQADGLHLGQEDVSFEEARKEFDGIIGLSASTYGEAIKAQQADYIGVGPVFPTTTKPKTACGVTELARIVKASKKPIIAIGGITLENVNEVMDAGVEGVAVISAIMNGNVFDNTRKFLQLVEVKK